MNNNTNRISTGHLKAKIFSDSSTNSGYLDRFLTIPLTINGSTQRSTSDDIITIEGTAVDAGSALAGVQVASDRYTGQAFGAVVQETGAFSCQVPLAVGDNLLTVTATDAVGNQTQATLTVTQQITELPAVTIVQPVNGAIVGTDQVTLSGTVRSSLSPDRIRMVFNDQIQFPTGSDGAYTFTFDNITLVNGPNTLTVTAETTYGNVSAVTTVVYQPQDTDTPEPPALSLNITQPVIYTTADTHPVSGSVTSAQGIQSVQVNGQSVSLTGSTAGATFSTALDLSAVDQTTVTVTATDQTGLTTTQAYQLIHDTAAPVITLDGGLQPSPEINPVYETPYTITGTVTEANLAGVHINGRSVGVAPGTQSDQWLFSAQVALTRGEAAQLQIQAWDLTGSRSDLVLIVRLDTTLDIEILTPAGGAELQADGAGFDLPVSAQIAGIAADDQVSAAIDGGTAQALTLSDETATGTLTMDAAEGDHTLTVTVTNAAGTQLASTTTSFSVINLAARPLAVSAQEPAGNTRDVEPNTFIAVYFNKPMADPALLTVEVQESAHGNVYDQPESGADITQQSKIELVQVHRDNEVVAGGLSYFPEDTTAAFYPEKDFAYGGTVYVNVSYDGAVLSRTSFTIRDLPTLVQGFVTDQFSQPVEGITVAIPELGKTAVTNKDGNYGFGFGEPAADMIPAGRYLGVANPDMKNSAFGTVQFWFTVNQGRLNSNGFAMIPYLNPAEPFRPAAGGQSQVVLADGDLTLDLSQATLSYPNGRTGDAVHAQFLKIQQTAYPALPAGYPSWVFSIQPAGIEVRGTVGVTLKMPKLFDSYDYIEPLDERVIIVGLDPDALQIVPVGVGLVDKTLKQVVSEKPVSFERLDIIGYALTASENQEILKQFAEDEISLEQMIGQLQVQN